MNTHLLITEHRVIDIDLFIVSFDQAVVFIGRKGYCEEYFNHWRGRYFPKVAVEFKKYALTDVKEEIDAYLFGQGKPFSFPYILKGTTFQVSVWKALIDLPLGKTCSYSALAETIGRAKAVRAVATAIGQNPLLIVVPCHRIIPKGGGIGRFRSGTDMKRSLLEIEQVSL